MKKSILTTSKIKWMGPSMTALILTLSVAGVASADAGARPFHTYVAQGYTEVANYAAFQMGNNRVAKHFHNKAQLAQSGGWVDPENPSRFTSRWGVDIAKARNLLIEVLSSDQLKQNPEMAAIALVNFDCFVAGVGQDGKPCLDAFAAALAALRPAVTVAATLRSDDKDQLDGSRSFAPDRGANLTRPDDSVDPNNPGSTPPIGVGIGSGDDTGNGTIVGIAVGAGDRSGQGGLVGVSALSGHQSGQGGLVGASALSGNQSGQGGLVGVSALSGHQSGQGGLVGASALSGNQSGRGGLVGASALSGNQSGQGDLVGISALSGENSGKGGVAGVSVLSGPPGDRDVAKIDLNSAPGSLNTATNSTAATVGAAREAIANVGGSLQSLNQSFDRAAIGLATGENTAVGRTVGDILGALGARDGSSSSGSSGKGGSDGSNDSASSGSSGGSASDTGANSGGGVSASSGGLGGAVGGAMGSVGGAVGGALDSVGGAVGGLGEGLGGSIGGLGGALGGN